MGQTRERKSKKAARQASKQTDGQAHSIKQLNLADAKKPDIGIVSTTISEPEDGQQQLSISHEVQTDNARPKIDSPPFEIRDTEAKGQAVFATRKIQPGTRIFCETPVIRLTQKEEDDDRSSDSSDDTVSVRIDTVDKMQHKAYFKLFDSKKSGFSRAKSIYYSNCYNLSGKARPSPTSPGGSCIGIIASRINHSCVPNVQFSFDETSNQMIFHAIKPIPKGKELVSNYDNVYETRSNRQRRQMLYYGFRCDCEACKGETEFWSKSDERRRGMIEARKNVRECENSYEVDGETNVVVVENAIIALEKLQGLLIKEGLIGLPLADVYRSSAKWSGRRRGVDGSGGSKIDFPTKPDMEELKKWKSKELEVCKTCLGERSPRVVSLIEEVKDDDATLKKTE